MTVGRVLVHEKDKGSGFALATESGRPGRAVLTAHHVVRGQDASALQFLAPTGRTIPVQRVETDDDLDVAVLHLPEDVTEALFAARARENITWQVQARPRGNDPKLTGIVTDTHRQFENAQGRNPSVIQLLVEETVGEYEGYSGSPVLLGTAEITAGTSVTSESPPVLGVLVEQLRWRVQVRPGQPKPPASNVLYAIPIQDALARFGLDTVWVSVGGGPPDSELVRRYLMAIAARFEERYGSLPHIALSLQRGTRAPAVVPAALRRSQEKLRALLAPRFSPEPPGPAPDAGRPVVDLAAFQEKHKRVALLGAPGAGKSTTLRDLFGNLGAPWSSTSADDSTRIPFFADLSEWHDSSLDLPAFLQGQLHRLGQPGLAERLPDLMRQGRTVLLLDGLNEIPQLRRDPVTGQLDDPRVDAIAAIGKRDEWRAVGCIVSCRANDFDGGPAWHDLHLLDVDDDRVAAFAEAYFHDAPEDTTFARDFLRELNRSSSTRATPLRSLVANPFFLVKALEYYSYAQTIPDSLTNLLRFSVAEALERERIVDGRAEELRRQLSRLAFCMTVNAQLGAVDGQRAAAWLATDDDAAAPDLAAARNVWRAAEGASLLIVSGDEVRFFHQLIQEFFAACFLRDRPLTAALLVQVASAKFREIWSLWAGLDSALVDELVPFLDDATPDARRAAAAILGLLGDRRAAEPLARSLDDPDADVRWTVALNLASWGDHRAVPLLVEGLRSADDRIRGVAAYALDGVSDSRAVAPLVEVLEGDPSSAVRVAAATALGGTSDDRALHPLIQAFVRYGDGEVSYAAALALGRRRDPRAVPDLLAQLDNRETEPGATRGLLAMRDVAVDPLIDLLGHDRNAKRRERAAFVLGLSRQPRAVPPLITALSDPDVAVRVQSADGLSYLGEPALGPLLDVLDEGEEEARRWALHALGRMADPRAVPHLIAVLRGESEQLAQAAAADALRSYQGAAVEPLVDILQDDLDPQARWYAAVALGTLGEPGVEPLVTAARSYDVDVRTPAVAGLGQSANRSFGFDPLDPRVVEALADALYDTEPVVRRIAAMALGGVGDVRAVPSLEKLTRSDAPDLRATAVDQLGRVEDASAVPVVVTVLGDPEPDVPQAASRALRRLLSEPLTIRRIVSQAIDGSASTGPPAALIDLLTAWRDPQAAPALVRALRQAMPPLIAALRDPELDVAFAAADTLKRAADPLVDVSGLLPDDPASDDPDDARLRSLAQEILVPLADPSAVSALTAMLGELDDEADDGWQPHRATIASLLGAVCAQEAAPALIALLESSNRTVCEESSEALVRLGDPRAVPAFIGLLNRRSRPPGLLPLSLAHHALALADERTPGLLLGALRDPAPDAESYLVDVLNELGELALVPLVTALTGPDPDLARAAAAALAPWDRQWLFDFSSRRRRRWRPWTDVLDRLSDTDVERLVTSVQHDDQRVARAARAVLEKLGHPVAQDAAAAEPATPEPAEPPAPPRDLDELRGDLASDDVETRAEAAQALGQRGDRQSVQPLISLLTDEAAPVREAAAVALGLLGDRSAVEPVAALLAEPSWPVCRAAAFALRTLRGAEALRLLLDALDVGGAGRGVAAFALADFDEQEFQEVGVAQVVDALLTSVRQGRRSDRSSDDSSVYHAATEVLPKLGDPAFTLLLTALDDEHDAVRHLAANVLSTAADIRALPLLQWMAEYDQGDYVSVGRKPRHVADEGLSEIRGAHRARAPLIESLASGDRLTRYGAAFQLAHLEWRDATLVLVEALEDSDRRIRWSAASWLGRLRDERGIAPLVAALGDLDRDVRDNAARALAGYGTVVVPAVVGALHADDANARAKAAFVLGYCGGVDTADRLVVAVGDPSSDVRSAAAHALSMLIDRGMTDDLDTDGAVDALVTAFRTTPQRDRWSDRWARQSLAKVLARIDAEQAVNLLVEALRSDDSHARRDAIGELGELGDPRAVAPLNEALSDDDPDVREDAADSLRKLADVRSVEPLIARLTDEATMARLAAIQALVALGDARAASPLVDSVRDDYPDVRSTAADGLVALADDAAVARLVARLDEELPESWRYRYPPVDEPPELDVLARIGPRAVEALIDALADPAMTSGLRASAAAALRRIGAAAVPALVNGLSSPEEGRAVAYARALVEAGEAVEPLLVALHDADESVRALAALALGSCDETRAIEPLAATLDDHEPSVRLCAAVALAQLDDDRGGETLIAALADDDVEAACFAANWLGGLGLNTAVEPLIVALQGASAELRGAAAVALGELGVPRALAPLERAAGDTTELSEGGTVGELAGAAAQRIRERRERLG